MKFSMRFYVPSSREEFDAERRKPSPYKVRQILECHTVEGSFIWQIFQAPNGTEAIPIYGFCGGLRLAGVEQEMAAYVLAGDVAKLELGDNPHPLDMATMAYIKALPPDHPLIPCGM